MTNYRPSDLADFTCPVPKNVPVPDGMEFAFRNATGVVCGPVVSNSNTLWREYTKRWTKTPIQPVLPTQTPAFITDVTVRFYWVDEDGFDEHDDEFYIAGVLDSTGAWNLIRESGAFTTVRPEAIHDFKLAKLVPEGDDDD